MGALPIIIFFDKIGEKNNKIMGALWAPSPYLFFLIGVSKKVMEWIEIDLPRVDQCSNP